MVEPIRLWKTGEELRDTTIDTKPLIEPGIIRLWKKGQVKEEAKKVEGRFIPGWPREPETEVEKEMQQLGFVPSPKKEPEKKPVFPEKEIPLWKMLLTLPLEDVIREGISRSKIRKETRDITIKKIMELPVSEETKKKVLALAVISSRVGVDDPFVKRRIDAMESELPETKELVSGLSLPAVVVPFTRLGIVSAQQAQRLIALATKSKLTRADLIAIHRGVMKDQAKMTTFKTMTADPTMRAELSRIARNKKMPLTEKIGDYLKKTFKPTEPAKPPTKPSLLKAPTKVKPEAVRLWKKPEVTPKIAPLELVSRKVEINYGGKIGRKTLDAVDVKVSGKYKATAIIEPPDPTKFGADGGVRLRIMDQIEETIIPGMTKEQALSPKTWERYFPEITKKITPVIKAIPKELEPLAVEARKFKSAEEFMESQDIVYRGAQTPELFGPVWVSPDKSFASEYGRVTEYRIPKDIDLFDVIPIEADELVSKYEGENIIDSLTSGDWWYQPEQKFINFMKKEGYAGFQNEDNILIFDKNIVKTKTQLQDIYTQATKGVEVAPKVAPEPIKAPPEAIPAEKGILEEIKEIQAKFAPQELSGFKNFISRESSIGKLRGEINTINGKRLSGQITAEKANKSIQEIRKKIKILADKLGVAEIVKGTKISPAIRKSGFFATKEIQTAPIRDVYNQSLHPHHMALRQDGYKLGGPFGEVFTKLWKPTEIAIRADKKFGVEIVREIRALGIKHKIKTDGKSLERMSDVIEGKVKATPQDEAYIKELRGVLDGLRNQANVVRRSMGKIEIGYIEDYIPHIQKTTLWNELLTNRATISDNLDFIIPNQTRNPFAFKRLFEQMPKAERNLYILLDRYVRAISKDIYITPAIENIKAYNNVLKNRELFNASRYWDDYIRQGLIGKQHRIDIAVGVGLKGRMALQKWNNMVNLAFLTGKVAWNLATQPLSYIMNVPMETGVINSIRAISQSFGRGLREYVRENSNVLAIKSSDVRAVAIGEGRNIQNRIYRTKINKYNDFISMLGSIEERELTLTSYIAGLDRAKQLGYKGEDALWFADLTAARTQSMYNKENRALIINSDIAKMIFPFQSFAVEMFNHAKEILSKSSGAMRLTYRQRLGKLFGLIIGIYLSSVYSKALTGRKKTTVGTFIPFIGSYVDMLIAKAMGEQYYGGRSPITVIQIGQDIIGGAKDFIEHGDLKKLRKVGINFGLALGGLGGGGQINNFIDGIMANIDEDVKNVEGDVMFEVEDALSKVIAPFFGVWATKEGREYWETDKEPEGMRLPSPAGIKRTFPKPPGLK